MSEQFKSLGDYLAKTNTRIEDFAARIGVSASYVSMLSNGQRTPSLPLALRIAAAAFIPVESLLPTGVTQGAGEVSERAHTPPEAGSIPVPATSPEEAA